MRAAAERPAALAQEDPVAATDQRLTDRGESSPISDVLKPPNIEREADEEEADEAEAEDGEVRAHHVGGVLGPAEAGLDEGEAGLHEDDEDGADDHPQQVDVLPEDDHGVDLLLGEGKRRNECGTGNADTDRGNDSTCTFGHWCPPEK